MNTERDKKKQVQVLLSTYQGERFLKEQLISIISQEQVDVYLLIRDDGSTDSTKSILNYFSNCYPEKIRTIYGQNIGIVASYFKLLEMASKQIEYIALSDQDDIWLPNKLYRAVNLLEKEKNKIPLLYASSVQLVDEQLRFLSSGIRYSNIKVSFGNALVENMCIGCTCVMNQKLLKTIQGKYPNHIIMHDFWIYLVATCFGKVIYDPTPSLLYRQHSSNEIGAATTIWESYKKRLLNFGKNRTRLTIQATEFLKLYEEKMSIDSMQLLNDFIASKKSVRARCKIVSNHKVYRQRKSDNFIVKCLTILGLL